jgi:hypothetical protein
MTCKMSCRLVNVILFEMTEYLYMCFNGVGGVGDADYQEADFGRSRSSKVSNKSSYSNSTISRTRN